MAGCSLCSAAIASLDGSRGADAGGEHAPDEIVDGRYRIVEVIGRGASATVYRAVDTRLGEEVALKMFRSGLGEKVAQEVLIARRVSHPNVCRVYDASVEGDAAYLSMELVRGETLAKRLARGGQEPDPDGPAIVRAILDGLGAAHAAGVIHRDLKPQNILVEPSGRVVVTDFGLARLEGEEESRARLIGTPATWSPEQARGEPATTASDVYSFGVVAYRLLVGKPFRVSDPAPFTRVPRPYRAMLERALALSPRDRAANAAEVAEILSRGSRRPLAVAVVLALVVGAVAAVAWAGRAPRNAAVAPEVARSASASVTALATAPPSTPVGLPAASAPSALVASASPSPPRPASTSVHAPHPARSVSPSPPRALPPPPPPQAGPDLLFGK